MLKEIENICNSAGELVLKQYSNQNIKVEIKNDGSPLTKADLKSEEFIKKELLKKFDYPVISEEKPIDYSIRKNWKKFWLIDPLDGTVDFLKKTDEFTINIALIEDNKPIIGVVYAPKLNLIYSAEKNKGASKNGKPISNSSTRKRLIAADSRSFSTFRTKKFLKDNNIHETLKVGSSLKLCYLSEGLIDVYPRFNGSKEWDTAAAHIICLESNCKVIDIDTEKEIVYNKKSFKNNFFIASRSNLNFKIKK